jgi:hypothetical protein
MTFDRSKARTSRPAKLDVESLGARIVPAHLVVIGAGGHVHLNLIEKLGSGETINFDRHQKPIIATDPVKFDAMNLPSRSSLPGKPPKSNPIIATNPVTFNAMTVPTLSPLPGRLPKSNPIIATNPVTFKAMGAPISSPVPGRLPRTNPIIATNPVNFTAAATPELPAPSSMPANVSQSLLTLYEQYEQNPAAFTGVTSSTDGANLVVESDKVGITVHDGNPSEFLGLMSELKQAGLTNVDSSAFYGTITGMLPIAELLTIANYSDNLSVAPELVASSK